jgi:hypothetical protein
LPVALEKSAGRRMKNLKILRKRRVTLPQASSSKGGAISFANSALIVAQTTGDAVCMLDTAISSLDSEVSIV